MGTPIGAEPNRSQPGEVSWFWDWVPAAGSSAAERAHWTAYLTGLLDEWVGEKVAAARAAWPADAEEAFPFSPGQMGQDVAGSLLERADGLPENCRLIWGAGFVGEQARWLPLLVLAEFRQALPDNPDYLMAMVGAEGFPDDVREPTVEYVTTDHGDGVRVLALADVAGEGLRGRVNAALRLEGRSIPRPPAGPAAAARQAPYAHPSPEAYASQRVHASPEVDVDVLLTTRVGGMDLLAVIGPGVEALMGMIATQFAALPGGGAPALRFVPAARQH